VLSSESCTDVFIVGGGPAGLAAAIAARRKGFSVTVADGAAPPIEKPCGEGMMPETLAALRDLGVSLPPGDGHPFQGIAFAQTGARVSADFSHGLGTGLRRTVLNQCLAARAEECGVRLLWQTPVVGMEGSEVRLSRGVIRASWIIGADGLGSRVRRWSNLDASTVFGQRYATRRHYRLKPWSNYAEVHWSGHAQAYITPIGSEEICVVMMAGNPQHASFESGLSEMPELKQKFEGAELCSRERGAVTATRSLRRIYRDNVALLGDASGGVDAITGEGLRMAFRQAFALADAMQARDLTQYQRAHRQLARRPRMMGSLLLWLGRNPRIRARAIRAMQHRPELFPRMLAAHVGHATPAQLVSTGASLGWNFLAV
jgi:flavin-dependent dehydrogenase